MIIDVQRLAPEGETLTGEEPASAWALEGDRDVRAEKPIRYQVRAYVVSAELIVRGWLETEVQLRCSRCGEFFPMKVREGDFSCAVDLDSPSATVDLTDEVRETMILLLPAFPVCAGQCRGLCPRCGRNLNEGTCECRPPADNRWDQLEKLQSP